MGRIRSEGSKNNGKRKMETRTSRSKSINMEGRNRKIEERETRGRSDKRKGRIKRKSKVDSGCSRIISERSKNIGKRKMETRASRSKSINMERGRREIEKRIIR